MLNTPTSVDSLPRLRRFTSSQSQTCSFAYLSSDEGSREKKNQEAKDDKENSEVKDETAAKESAATPQPPTKQTTKEKAGERQVETREAEPKSKSEVKQGRTSEVLRQPKSENQAAAGIRSKADRRGRGDLVELPLAGLNPPEGHGGQATGEGESGGDAYGDDQKICCGFFFKVSYRIIHLIFIVVLSIFSCSPLWVDWSQIRLICWHF